MEELKLKGNLALQQQNFSDAINFYTEAINIDPTNRVLFSNRSAAYEKHGKANLALIDAEMCINLSKNWSKGYWRKGAALVKLKRFFDAIKVYEEGISQTGVNQEFENAIEACKNQLAEIKLTVDKNNNSPVSLNQEKKENKTVTTDSLPDASIRSKLAKLPNLMSEEQYNALYYKCDDQSDQQLFMMHEMMSTCGNAFGGNWIDTRIPQFHTELANFPAGCDTQESKKRLLQFYIYSRCRQFNYLTCRLEGKIDPKDYFKRIGTFDDRVHKWFSKADKGQICPFEHESIYDPRVLHSFANEACHSIILTPGTTHVAVGFTDLGLFHSANFNKPISKEKPLKWIGYESSAYCVAKTAVIVAMLSLGASSEHVLQVWYSAAWSKAALKSFREAIGFLLASNFFMVIILF